jgi:hypothetical protein
MTEVRLVVRDGRVEGDGVDLDAELALAALAGGPPRWAGLLKVARASLRFGGDPAAVAEFVDEAQPLDWQGRWGNLCGHDGVRLEWHWLWRATADAVEHWDMIRALSACASTRVLVELYWLRDFWLDVTFEAPDFAAAVAARPDASEDVLVDVARRFPATWTILSENAGTTTAVHAVMSGPGSDR